jgi:hypothetical protein
VARVDLTGNASFGGGFQGPDLSHWAPGTPAFHSLVIFGALLLLAFMVFRSFI